MSEPTAALESIVVHLLEPTYLRAIKSWRFEHEPRVTIGRGDDCQVELNDPYVSRLHVELVHGDGGWQLISRGRNGVSVGGQQLEQGPIPFGETFRLGKNGPLMKVEFGSLVPVAASDNPVTLSPESAQVFLLDTQKIDNEVKEIAEGDYFQSLQQKVRDLRRLKETRQ